MKWSDKKKGVDDNTFDLINWITSIHDHYNFPSHFCTKVKLCSTLSHTKTEYPKWVRLKWKGTMCKKKMLSILDQTLKQNKPKFSSIILIDKTQF